MGLKRRKKGHCVYFIFPHWRRACSVLWTNKQLIAHSVARFASTHRKRLPMYWCSDEMIGRNSLQKWDIDTYMQICSSLEPFCPSTQTVSAGLLARAVAWLWHHWRLLCVSDKNALPRIEEGHTLLKITWIIDRMKKAFFVLFLVLLYNIF